MMWHVIFVLGGFEEMIQDKLSSFDHIEAFIPKKVKLFKKKGQVIKDITFLFPNYVFVKSELDYKEFNHIAQTHLKPIRGFIKVLRHDKEGLEVLYPSEKQFLEQFTNSNHIIEESIGFIENDQIIITEGPLKGYESMIRKIDRHKRIAFIDITMFGISQTITVGCDIIKKI